MICEKVDAQLAFTVYRNTSGNDRAILLETIAEEIESVARDFSHCYLGNRAPGGRIQSETVRTIGQLRLFAEVARKEFWLDAVIDTALPNRQPLPKMILENVLYLLVQ